MPNRDEDEDELVAAHVSRVQRETLLKPEKVWVPATLVFSIIAMVWLLANWVADNKEQIKAIKERQEAYHKRFEAIEKEQWTKRHMRTWVRDARRGELKDLPDPDEINRQLEP